MKKILEDILNSTSKETDACIIEQYKNANLTQAMIDDIKKIYSSEEGFIVKDGDNLSVDAFDYSDIDIIDTSNPSNDKGLDNDVKYSIEQHEINSQLKIKIKNDQINKLKNHLKILQVELLKYKVQEITKKEIINEDTKRKLAYINSHSGLIKVKARKNKKIVPKTIITPVFFLTDLHIGEVISTLDMNGVNQYNRDIAIARINQITDDFIEICTSNFDSYQYPGIYLILGGDNITGSLHDLPESNDLSPIQQVIVLVDLLQNVIEKFKKIFGKVIIPAVTGNHGRLADKIKMKGRTSDSLETLVIQFIRDKYKQDDKVVVLFDDSDEIFFEINSRSFLLMHGDSLKGGNGIGGPLIGIKRGRAKINERYGAINKRFDTLIIGHYHIHHVEDSLIIGASLKGYDEYTKYNNMSYSEPGVTTFFVNEHGDILFSTNLKIRN